MESLTEFAQTERGRRAIGISVALAIEALLLLMLLAMGMREELEPVPIAEVATFDVPDAAAPESPPADDEEMPSALEPEPRPAPEPIPQPSAAPEPAPLPPAAIIPRPVPAAPARVAAPPANAPVCGPPAPANRPRDSARVGTAPGGQPLYAAAWHRRPRDDEMRGYLSTAQPGYATISCRTVPDYRVEDCVLETEYPGGSDMGRAVLSMAWQFRIRPPMIGGRYQVGEWVRIRITYTVEERLDYGG